MIRTKRQKECVYSHLSTFETLTIFASTQSACAQTCFRCTKNNFIFTCANKLEYVNYHFFFFREKGGLWINKVYELLEILRYTHALKLLDWIILFCLNKFIPLILYLCCDKIFIFWLKIIYFRTGTCWELVFIVRLHFWKVVKGNIAITCYGCWCYNLEDITSMQPISLVWSSLCSSPWR